MKPASAWRVYVGDPPVCGPADHWQAGNFHARLVAAIERRGWTKYERGNLYRERDKWARRMRGWDARFEVVGTRRGPVSVGEAARIEVLAAGMKGKAVTGRRKEEKSDGTVA